MGGLAWLVERAEGGHRIGLLLAACLAGALACAPGEPSSPPWNEPQVRLMWPAPPESPRIEYAGEIGSARDLGRRRGWLERLRDLLLGEEASTMVKPVAVAKNARGLLVVADPSFPTVHFFDLKGRRYRRLGDGVASRLRSPVGVAVDEGSRVYVSDSGVGRVFVFDSDRALVAELGEGILERPTGLALSPDHERLFVVDTVGCRVVIFDRDGREVGRFGRRGTAPGEFNAPTFIAVGADGRVAVSDSNNFRVQLLEGDGAPIASFGRVGDGAGTFARPKGIGADSRGRLYVVDGAFENVQIFGRDGTLMLAFGGPGHGAGEFTLPVGLFLDADDTIWVADSYNRRVQAFRPLAEGTPGG